MKGQIIQVMIKHTYFNPSQMWDELSNYKSIIGPSCLGPSLESWAKLALDRFLRGPSCHGPSWFWAELSCTTYLVHVIEIRDCAYAQSGLSHRCLLMR